MAHLSEKSALRIHRIIDTAHVRYSLFHLSCTHVQNSHAANELITERF
jgi:hypothetical protein